MVIVVDTDFVNDEELMLEIKSGSMKAFDILYHKYSKKLFGFTYSVIKSKEEAETIVQDVFLSVWLNREQIEKSASVKSYIFTIAYHSSISAIRKNIKDSRFLEQLTAMQDVPVEPSDMQVEYSELNEKLGKIIDGLPARQKEIFYLHKVEGLKYSEIAGKLHISANTIENHMSRALKTIREKFGECSLSSILFFYLFIS